MSKQIILFTLFLLSIQLYQGFSLESKNQQTLFDKVKIGDLTLANRFVMSSMTRTRCSSTGVPTDIVVKHYAQRASAGLIIGEGMAVANQGRYANETAGIYTKEQIAGWKNVTEAVHAKGGLIYGQLWHAGRVCQPSITGEEVIGPSAIAAVDEYAPGMPSVVPKEMTKEDIAHVIGQFRQGAINAKEAGFDGVQVHGSNGYILDEFLRDVSNHRTDEYGGSVENRARFYLEVIDNLIEVWGANKVGVKLSPVGRNRDMYDSNPLATFSYILQELDKRGIAFAELSEADPFNPPAVRFGLGAEQIAEVSKTFRPYFKGTIIINLGQTAESGAKAVHEGYADLVSFGKDYVSNPDLVERTKAGVPLAPWNADFFLGNFGEKGYTDYPTYQQSQCSFRIEA